VDVKAKNLLLEIRMLNLETELQKLGDLAKGTEMVSRGLEVILQGLWWLYTHPPCLILRVIF